MGNGQGSSAGSDSWLSSAAPIIGAGLDFVSGLGTSLFNLNQARKNRAFQERMYNRQVADNIRFWNMQNEYNLPSAQLQRLEDAGLNPLMMYEGGSAVIPANGIQSGNAPSGDSARGDMRTAFGQAALQAALIRAEIRNKNADSLQKETSSQNIQQSTQGMKLDYQLATETYHIRKLVEFKRYDLMNAEIDKMRNDVFQSSFVNGANMAALTQNVNLAIRAQNLNEYQVGNNVLLGWQNLSLGKIMANAAWKQAGAALMDATTRAKLAPFQIGVMRQTANKLFHESEFLRKSMPARLTGLDIGNKILTNQKNNLSWQSILSQSNIDYNQSQIFLNTIRGHMYESQTNQIDQNILFQPATMLLNFGNKLGIDDAGGMSNGYELPSYSY